MSAKKSISEYCGLDRHPITAAPVKSTDLSKRLRKILAKLCYRWSIVEPTCIKAVVHAKRTPRLDMPGAQLDACPSSLAYPRRAAISLPVRTELLGFPPNTSIPSARASGNKLALEVSQPISQLWIRCVIACTRTGTRPTTLIAVVQVVKCRSLYWKLALFRRVSYI